MGMFSTFPAKLPPIEDDDDPGEMRGEVRGGAILRVLRGWIDLEPLSGKGEGADIEDWLLSIPEQVSIPSEADLVGELYLILSVLRRGEVYLTIVSNSV